MKTLLVTPAVSDLFFNHDHPLYDAVRERAHKAIERKLRLPSEIEYREAIFADARQFCDEVELAYGANEDPEALADDFLARV